MKVVLGASCTMHEDACVWMHGCGTLLPYVIYSFDKNETKKNKNKKRKQQEEQQSTSFPVPILL